MGIDKQRNDLSSHHKRIYIESSDAASTLVSSFPEVPPTPTPVVYKVFTFLLNNSLKITVDQTINSSKWLSFKNLLEHSDTICITCVRQIQSLASSSSAPGRQLTNADCFVSMHLHGRTLVNPTLPLPAHLHRSRIPQWHPHATTEISRPWRWRSSFTLE